jgi:hypothetical protein
MEGEVNQVKGLLSILVVALVVAGCGESPGPPHTGGGYQLYEAAATKSSHVVAVIGSRSHAVERVLPWGTLSGKHLYSVRGSTLLDINPETGSTARTLRLPYSFELPQASASGVAGGLSQSGRWLVLEHPPGQIDSAGSHMLVVDTSLMKVAAPIDLPGSFQFDAVSNDGKRVYMIEYISDVVYRVRVYDIQAGRLDPTIVVDKSDPHESMTGIRLSGIASPDGVWLFSVYSRPNKGAFIHALNLTQPFALCLELPGAGYVSNPDELRWSLALSSDGTRLFAANGAIGSVAEVNAGPDGGPSVTRVVHIGGPGATTGFIQNVEAKEFGTGGAVLSADGKTLVITGKTGLVWVDTATFRTRSPQLTGWRVASLMLSPDGSMVYAISDSSMIAELSLSSPGAQTTFGAVGGQPLALIRVDPASP